MKLIKSIINLLTKLKIRCKSTCCESSCSTGPEEKIFETCQPNL